MEEEHSRQWELHIQWPTGVRKHVFFFQPIAAIGMTERQGMGRQIGDKTDHIFPDFGFQPVGVRIPLKDFKLGSDI